MAAKRTVFVKSIGDGWSVKSEGAKRAARTTGTQTEAIQIGRRIAEQRGGELVVYRTDGTIRSKDAFGPGLFVPRSS